MIINVRGIHGSGKSTVVRSLLKKLPDQRPVYGILGPRMPEAYRCLVPMKRPKSSTTLFVMGPYASEATCGGDYLTKKGVQATVEILERYSTMGHVIFESVLVSTRFMEPSIGAWMVRHKDEVLHATLDTTYDACFKSVMARQKRSIAKPADPKHIERQWIDFGRVTKRLTELGFRMEVCSRENAVQEILGWLSED